MASNKKVHTKPGQGKDNRNTADKSRFRRFLFFWLPVIVVILGFIYISAFDPVRKDSTRQTRGIVTETSMGPGDGGQSSSLYTITLADGRTITLNILTDDKLKTGSAVLVEEKETTIFKRKIYQFVKVIR